MAAALPPQLAEIVEDFNALSEQERLELLLEFREAISFEAFGQEVLRRRAAAGDPPVPRNAGNNRTPSKRALLKAIEEAGGTW